MDDFNHLEVTTVQPEARATMRGTQGQKPRKRKKADRDQPRREEAERKKAEHEQELQDMLERQQSGKKLKQLRTGKKNQLQQSGKVMQDVDAEAAEMDPAQTSKSPVANEIQGFEYAAAGTELPAQPSSFPAAKKRQKRTRLDAGRMKPAQTSSSAAGETQYQSRAAATTMRPAQTSKIPAAKKTQGLDRTPVGTLNRSFKVPAAKDIQDQDQMSRSPSAVVPYPAVLLPSAGRVALNEEALRRLGSPYPYHVSIDTWAKQAAMEMGTTPPPPDEVIDSIEVDNANDPTLIDCTTSPRVFIRILGNQYPIWKPSDGDGPDTGSGDIWGAMLLPPLDQRWKVFQTDIGEYDWKTGNDPPKLTRLDDRAVHLVLHSNIPKGKLGTFWPHDFNSNGIVRRQRIRIGRPAIKDANADGNDKFEHTVCGGKAVGLYYFSGTANYQPVHYRLLPRAPDPSLAELSEAAKKKRRIDAMLDAEEAANPHAHGHNQYTPKDMLTKYGAPSTAKPKVKHHKLPRLPRPDTYLTNAYNPIHEERTLVGGVKESAHESVVSEKKKAHKKALGEATTEELQNELESRAGGGLLDDDEEEDDLSELIKRPKPKTLVAAKRPLLAAIPTAEDDVDDENRPVTRRAFHIPRVLGMIDRVDLEIRISEHVLEGKPSKADLAGEFAREHVKAEQRGQECELLREMLPVDVEDDDL